MNAHLKKRSLGIYDTPDRLAKVMADWAIRHRTDKILEPGFGGCTFVENSIESLRELGAKKPGENLYGCDLDDRAFRELKNKLHNEVVKSQFHQADFMALTPDHFDRIKFSVVIGNPPYVSHHEFSKEYRLAHLERKLDDEYLSRLDGKANLWAAFVIHGLNFLKDGGRMAWVLPSSYLHADYAEYVRELICSKFDRVLNLSVRDPLFVSEGASVNSVIVFADGFNSTSSSQRNVETVTVGRLEDIDEKIKSWASRVRRRQSSIPRNYMGSLDRKAGSCFLDLLSLPEAHQISSMAKVSIGVVTGANKDLILSRDAIMTRKIQAGAFRFIAAKANQIPGIRVTKSGVTEIGLSDSKCWLLDTSEVERIGTHLKSYLDEVWTSHQVVGNLTFGKRPIWHQPDDGANPDAFFTYMNHIGPRMVRNQAGVNCTNSLYRVDFSPKVTRGFVDTACISMQSSFSQIHSEVLGRVYGQGLLKHEPKDVGKIAILMPKEIDPTYTTKISKQADQYIKQGDTRSARMIADEFVVSFLSETTSRKKIPVLQKALDKMRQERIPGRRVDNG